jgi:peroxiredoxin
MTSLQPGTTLPDVRLPDHTGTLRQLSELAGTDPMVLLIARGEHCPRERLHHKAMLALHEWCTVAFTSLVTVLPGDVHAAHKLRLSVGAGWTFLADIDLELQRHYDLREYTDTANVATVPHTLVVAPGLVVDKVYVGYWFWGRPSPQDLWADLRDLSRRIRPDYDPLLPDVRAAWERSTLQPAR